MGLRLQFIVLLILLTFGCNTPATRSVEQQSVLVAAQDPAQLYGELFEKVQLGGAFEDSKHFVDAIPRFEPNVILDRYMEQNPETPELVRRFVGAHFSPPAETLKDFKSERSKSVDSHIKRLWQHLKREADDEVHSASSLIALPYSYVVPGGRFREIYYWDSYFTMLGLLLDGEDELFKNMVQNFAHLLRTTGRIPNGNRDYYRGRSQPPFFSLMVALWQEKYGTSSALQFLDVLKIEHGFWMMGERSVAVEGGRLNRYWDDFARPRPEAFKEGVKLANEAKTKHGRSELDVYRELRAGAESGWDYSTRWFQDPSDFSTIAATSFAPVDLNSLIYFLELKTSELAAAAGDQNSAEEFRRLANARRVLIHKLMWSERDGTFRDYNFKNKSLSRASTIAAVVPLFVGLASGPQARQVSQIIERNFLKAGGVVTTLRVSGQQWDAPNGWPPHQWMAFAGLKRYHHDQLANRIRKRWLKTNKRVFRATGKMMEKYNVVNVSLKSGGGEYPLQDGFGWTNGVFRALTVPKESLKHLGVVAQN